MKRAAEQMQVPFSLAMAKVRTLIKKERLVDYTYAYVWLFQVMALSASLYGCQVWSTPFLHPSKAERTVLSRSQALFFKGYLIQPALVVCSGSVGSCPCSFTGLGVCLGSGMPALIAGISSCIMACELSGTWLCTASIPRGLGRRAAPIPRGAWRTAHLETPIC